ncbi:hypothetical protein GLOIN_2v1839901 [Rhizophagus irregularis DAOM 181602=DAOM 197198]|uniref:Uncharacterized protein n=1 Tax=Rhizophagus irregularis (strain DAOM 181602 / DAOM 197198 / MUCL 43194) TaxID=747089 RepID=A0A2P4Q6Z5_RHIID|nr:hypothetical protein GLOIN_2v1839901 [Rhizophagus irregularis DAOM 181602=DAOM 197198]POG73425.1 hypothetical protein GLOIN_2v1839901 [Rhizophagus irregularis DAOM 181602=DAOM 197198]|eukprot:XP_025180291.1 hypothetical protein GLOIN_2v1839901 [Rhizophagus irregularis DAOM 181602=DAOM 197198]
MEHLFKSNISVDDKDMTDEHVQKQQSVASADRKGDQKQGKKPDVMFMECSEKKFYKLILVESSCIVCTKIKEENDSVKLWREMNNEFHMEKFQSEDEVVYKICEKNMNRFIEKETCMGIFAEDKQLENVFIQWVSQCDDRRRVYTDAFIFTYDIAMKKKKMDQVNQLAKKWSFLLLSSDIC